MSQSQRKVVTTSSSEISHSFPCSPIVRPSKQFLQRTPIPNFDSPKWKDGIPTPIHDGDLTPNQEALGLLTGFATGQVRMSGNSMEHLPTSKNDESIMSIHYEYSSTIRFS